MLLGYLPSVNASQFAFENGKLSHKKVNVPMNSMVIFHSYGKLPKATINHIVTLDGACMEYLPACIPNGGTYSIHGARTVHYGISLH